jgi:hypothetical protein
MVKLLVFTITLVTAHTAVASTPIAQAYIERYQSIAVKEMHRAGIPASIKLAQGLLESNWGRSDLATQANNHFGIKCGGRWSGPSYYKEDDDYNKKGDLIKSCFRSFADAQRSYEAHSDFLRDPKKAYRYGRLFELDPTDYRAWAHGLYDAGYATDPKYPNKIISVIEKYELYKFDVPTEVDLAIEHIPEAQPVIAYEPRERHAASIPIHSDSYKISAINRVPMVIARGETTIADIAASVGLSSDLLVSYNDGYAEPLDRVAVGSYVYLQKKKRSFVGETEQHTVLEGETMESIAQLYGMRIENLYAKNRMPQGAIPDVGTTLNLRRSVHKKERPTFTTADGRVPEFLDM